MLCIIYTATTVTFQAQNQVQKEKPQQQEGAVGNKGEASVDPEKAAMRAAMKMDRQQGNCFECHEAGPMVKDCPKPSDPEPASS
ncbi:hypothetical protein V7S43_002744 [Phytophthora oleae]|uniref:CCHC-type domain-containing protein n=1 Tax=Phytophthora oleae TaxID=2107226 RepID=A0ABD3G288_9STRA